MLSFKIEGLADLETAMRAVGKKAAREAAFVAVQHACKPVERLAKAKAALYRDTGALARSMSTRVGYKKRNVGVYGFIGPAKNYVEGAGKQKRWPAKYAHLVEKGTYRTSARPFMRPAIDQAAGQALQTLGKTFGVALSVKVDALPEVKRARMNKRIASKNTGAGI
jgi:HK97 gp10 family phage protein